MPQSPGEVKFTSPEEGISIAIAYGDQLVEFAATEHEVGIFFEGKKKLFEISFGTPATALLSFTWDPNRSVCIRIAASRTDEPEICMQ